MLLRKSTVSEKKSTRRFAANLPLNKASLTTQVRMRCPIWVIELTYRPDPTAKYKQTASNRRIEALGRRARLDSRTQESRARCSQQPKFTRTEPPRSLKASSSTEPNSAARRVTASAHLD